MGLSSHCRHPDITTPTFAHTTCISSFLRVGKRFQSHQQRGADTPVMVGLQMTKAQPKQRGICLSMECKEEPRNQIVRSGRQQDLGEFRSQGPTCLHVGIALCPRRATPKADEVYIPELPPKERDRNFLIQSPWEGGFPCLSLRAGATLGTDTE